MLNKTKIGIITMHRVQNCGSALQAYALQYIIEKIGYDVELIDYQYPYIRKQNLYCRLRTFIGDIIYYPRRIWYNNQKKKFQTFYTQYFKLSRYYKSQEELINNPPKYDLYITGSDQVWNPIHTQGDPIFMCSFIPDNAIPRIAYSASFSVKELPDNYKSIYAKHLSKYKSIAVRENTGKHIIDNLIDLKADVVCDPTLLLNKEEWSLLMPQQRRIKRNYILVYVLTYAYNPYPYVNNLITKVANELSLPIVLLGSKYSGGTNVEIIQENEVGPIDFIQLFYEASFVITTSFHGTAFAINYGKPFYSLVSSKLNDERMVSLLNNMNLNNHKIVMNQDLKEKNPRDIDVNYVERLNEYRDNCLALLVKQLDENVIANVNILN